MLSAVCALCVCTLAPAAVQAGGQAEVTPSTEFQGEGVLGTSYFLRVDAEGDQADALEKVVLDEVERLRRILDRYDPKSELRLLRAGETVEVSSDLLRILDSCRRWREATDGAFDPAVGQLDAIWRRAEAEGRRPDRESLVRAVRSIAEARWTIDDGRVTPSEIPLSLDGLAKGAILDSAVAAAREAGARDVVLEIGGDIRAIGAPIEVLIAHPDESADNGRPLGKILLDDAAVATSGNQLRGYVIGSERVGHVLDPRTGDAVRNVRQASVVAPTAEVADALSTALMVLPPKRGKALVEARDGVECLLVDSAGRRYMTDGWPAVGGVEVGPTGVPWPAEKQVRVDFTFERPARTGRRRRGAYRRPYVAVWVETLDGTPVRTLCLWIERERWLRDLRRWHRLHKNDRPHIDAVTRPTRNPGSYQLVWDGLADDGSRLPLGKYQIVVEAAREHGTYQIERGRLDTRASQGLVTLDGNVEISSCTLRFGGAR
ncbi:MAG: DUF2271 domain-containing protein [Planctomycetota bacterium]